MQVAIWPDQIYSLIIGLAIGHGLELGNSDCGRSDIGVSHRSLIR